MKTFSRIATSALLAALSLPALAAETPAAAQLSPAGALQKLMDGNARFVSGDMQHPNLSKEVRETLAKGQSPYAVIVGCSDSRVPPELLFDAGPGDLFVIRLAGNIVDDYAQASIEYAVAVLGTPLVVVLGHESCGAVGAAVAAETQDAEFGGHIHDLVEAIRPAVEKVLDDADEKALAPDVLLDQAVAENARRTADDLAKSRPYVGPAAKDGKIALVAARYDLDTGTVTRVDQDHDHDHD